MPSRRLTAWRRPSRRTISAFVTRAEFQVKAAKSQSSNCFASLRIFGVTIVLRSIGNWQSAIGNLIFAREHSGRTEMARAGRRLHRRGGTGKRDSPRPSRFTAALTRRRTACTSAIWCRCSRCGGFNCSAIIPLPWPAARPASIGDPSGKTQERQLLTQGNSGPQHRQREGAAREAARF